MFIKQILKPDRRKIVIFVMMFSISFILFQQPGIGYVGLYYFNFFILDFILEIITWYLLSCLVIWISDRILSGIERTDDYNRIEDIRKRRERLGTLDSKIKLKSLEAPIKKEKEKEKD